MSKTGDLIDMKKALWLSLLAGPALLAGAAAVGEMTAGLQSELNRLVADSRVPGVTLAVILPDETVISLAAGLADTESGRAMKADDLMFSGSIGKTYVMALVMQLAQEKKLALDDPLKKYLGTESWFPRLANADSISLRMLLNHTAGLPEYVQEESFWAEVKAHPDRVWSGAQRLAYILDKPGLHEAGKGWSYADSHYILLGMVIEKLAGQDYYRELQRRLLQPFRLERTLPADRRVLPGLIPGYSRLGAPFSFSGRIIDAQGRYRFNPQVEWTGGGLLSNAVELARWARILYSGRAFPVAWLGEVLQGVKTDTTYRYGLATIIWSSVSGPVYGHTGFVPGYNAVMAYAPVSGIAAAMQFNCDYVAEALQTDRYACLDQFIRLVAAELERKRIPGPGDKAI